MPPSSTAPKPKPKNAHKKIPIWAWISAAAIGIIIGYMILKRSSSASAVISPSSSGNTTGLPAGQETGGGGASGSGDSPNPILQALGLTPSNQPGDQPPSGDTSIAPSQSQTSTTPTQSPFRFDPAPDPTSVVTAERTGDYSQVAGGTEVPVSSHPGTYVVSSTPGVVYGSAPAITPLGNAHRPGFQLDA